jgi:hypothetical protein
MVETLPFETSTGQEKYGSHGARRSSTERADHLAVLWFVAEAEGLPAKVMRAYFTEERLMESELYKSIFSKGEAKGRTEGEAKTLAEMVIRVLMLRLGTMDPGVRDRIRAMSDLETLKLWCDEALLAADADAARRLAEKIRNASLP